MNYLDLIKLKLEKMLLGKRRGRTGVAMLAEFFVSARDTLYGHDQDKKLIAVVKCFGIRRGRKIARKVRRAGKPLTLYNFFAYYDLQSDGYEMSAEPRENGLLLEIRKCPFREAIGDLAEIYCEHIDESIICGYNPDITLNHTPAHCSNDGICRLLYTE